MDSIRQSGFYQLMEQKYPQIADGIKSIESEDEVQDFLKLTGLKFDNMQSFSFTFEGLESMAKAKELGRTPKIGSELDFLLQTRFTGKINHNELISVMLEALEKEKGKEERDRVEKTKRTNDKTTYMTIPSDVMGKEASATDARARVPARRRARVCGGTRGGRRQTRRRTRACSCRWRL